MTTTSTRRISISRNALVTGVALLVVTAVAVVFAALYFSAEGKLSDRAARAADDVHATQVASDYAIGASSIDYRDTKSWLTKLKTNTTTQLAAKFDATAPQLEQILLPLQWTSSAAPITAVVTSESGGVYKVNAFLTVTSANSQNPQGAQTTVTYALTVDKNAGWKVTDVGGLDGALPLK